MTQQNYGVDEFMAHAARLERELKDALREVGKRQKAHTERMRELTLQRDETLVQLLQILLPDLSPPSLTRAGRVAAYGRILIREETIGRLEADRARLAARLAEIDADPRYRDRELLRAPRVGTLARELDELEDFRKPMAETVALAAHPRLDELLQSGYGTEAYQTPWWRLSYYADWKAGDEILERFPGKKDFGELRGELISAREGVAVYDQRLAELRAQIAEGEALEHERDETATRLANLEVDHLAEWRERIARHIVDIDLADLGDRLTGEEAAQLLVKTFVGLTKKMEYLERVHQEQVVTQEARLREELDKLNRDRMKYARPKKAYTRFDGEKFEKRFAPRAERYGKHWKRYDRTYDTVWGFHRYERASFAEDFLWWDLMTDGQLDGNFIPEVQEFHRHHPHYVYAGDSIDDNLDDAAAHAVIEADRAAGDSTSLHDPS